MVARTPVYGTHGAPTRIGWLVIAVAVLAWTAPISGVDSIPDESHPDRPSPKKLQLDELPAQPIAESATQLPPFGADSTPVDPELDMASKESAFAEIKQIQQRMGGSVLQGSTLMGEADSPFANFDAHVREQLGLPELPSAKPESARPDKSPLLGLTDTRPESEIVQDLRQQVANLDTIANEMESLRAYTHADRLRKAANELRQIARRLDVQK